MADSTKNVPVIASIDDLRLPWLTSWLVALYGRATSTSQAREGWSERDALEGATGACVPDLLCRISFTLQPSI